MIVIRIAPRLSTIFFLSFSFVYDCWLEIRLMKIWIINNFELRTSKGIGILNIEGQLIFWKHVFDVWFFLVIISIVPQWAHTINHSCMKIKWHSIVINWYIYVWMCVCVSCVFVCMHSSRVRLTSWFFFSFISSTPLCLSALKLSLQWVYWSLLSNALVCCLHHSSVFYCPSFA